jgi:hypothetical protein
MRSVFVTTSAFLGRIDSETRCAFWAEEPSEHGFDASRLIGIDLAMSPSAALARRISWDAVEVDDCFTGPNGSLSGSTLGPRWPELQIAGVVLLEERFLGTLAVGLRPACPPKGTSGFDYEYKSVLYWPNTSDPRAGKRYAGHHAHVLEERGSLARLKIYPPGTGAEPDAQSFTMWIDLDCAEQCDAGPNRLTQIGVGDAPKTGALFLIAGSVAE